MLRSSTKQKLPTNFDAISKNVKILKIGPVEPKLWKIRHKNVFIGLFSVLPFWEKPGKKISPTKILLASKIFRLVLGSFFGRPKLGSARQIKSSARLAKK